MSSQNEPAVKASALDDDEVEDTSYCVIALYDEADEANFRTHVDIYVDKEKPGIRVNIGERQYDKIFDEIVGLDNDANLAMLLGIGPEVEQDPESILQKAESLTSHPVFSAKRVFATLVNLSKALLRDRHDARSLSMLNELRKVTQGNTTYKNYMEAVSSFLRRSGPGGAMDAEQAAYAIFITCQLVDGSFADVNLNAVRELVVQFHAAQRPAESSSSSRNPNGRGAMSVARFAALLAISANAFPEWRAKATADWVAKNPKSKESPDLTKMLTGLLSKYQDGTSLGIAVETLPPAPPDRFHKRMDVGEAQAVLSGDVDILRGDRSSNAPFGDK